jgi:hypothetical protein
MKKIISLILFYFLLVGITVAQTLKGKYVQLYSEYGHTFSFKGNQFTDTTYLHLGERLVGGGTYAIKNNQLVLKYEYIPDADSSTYSLIQNKKFSKDMGQVFIKVHDAIEKLPFNFAFCGLKDDNNQLVLNFYTDTLGKANMSIYNTRKFNILSVGALGYYSVDIPIVELRGSNSELIISLKPKTIQYISKHYETYEIGKITPTELNLLNKNKMKMFFKNEE